MIQPFNLHEKWALHNYAVLIQITITPEIVKLSCFFFYPHKRPLPGKQMQPRTCTTVVWQGMFTELITELSTHTDVYDTYSSNLAAGYLPISDQSSRACTFLQAQDSRVHGNIHLGASLPRNENTLSSAPAGFHNTCIPFSSSITHTQLCHYS